MTELEKVEKLREKADVSFAEAKEALDISNGDVLSALIYLEKQGKSTIPAGGGFFSGAGPQAHKHDRPEPGRMVRKERGERREYRTRNGESFKDAMKRFGAFCVDLLSKGTTNHLDAIKNDEVVFSCPVLALVALLMFFFWITVPVFIVTLFLGFHYKFRGEELGKDSVNSVMDGASAAVVDIKMSIKNKTAKADGE